MPIEKCLMAGMEALGTLASVKDDNSARVSAASRSWTDSSSVYDAGAGDSMKLVNNGTSAAALPTPRRWVEEYAHSWIMIQDTMTA